MGLFSNSSQPTSSIYFLGNISLPFLDINANNVGEDPCVLISNSNSLITLTLSITGPK